MFATTAMVLFVGNLVYLIYGTTDLQPWDAVDYVRKANVEDAIDTTAIKEAKLIRNAELKTCA